MEKKTYEQVIESLKQKFKYWKKDETIYDWSLENEDLTVCSLCGKTSACLCHHFICPCGNREEDCRWPEDKNCPDRTKE